MQQTEGYFYTMKINYSLYVFMLPSCYVCKLSLKCVRFVGFLQNVVVKFSSFTTYEYINKPTCLTAFFQ